MTRPATHASVMVAEVLQHAGLRPGNVVVDATIGDGGHAAAILQQIGPAGRLIGLDVDPRQVARATARLMAIPIAPSRWVIKEETFVGLARVLATDGLSGADVILADLGVSSAQFDDPARGLNYKAVGPLDMRLSGSAGEPASELLMRLTGPQIVTLLRDNADEPQAELIAAILGRRPIATTHGLAQAIRTGLAGACPELSKGAIKDSVRRTFQALRVAVNDELTALEALLQLLPRCLLPGGRAVIVTFHVGEERRVKAAFAAGRSAGVYCAISQDIIRPSRAEILANRRISSARLHWAILSAA